MTRLRATWIALGACWLIASGCSPTTRNEGLTTPEETPHPTSELDGIYEYHATAGQGEVRGTLELRFAAAGTSGFPARISGTWSLESEGNVGQLGPQIGDGHLAGELGRDGEIHLNLNPGYADNNVFLIGTLEGSPPRLEGAWQYSNFTGPVNGGAFLAEQR